MIQPLASMVAHAVSEYPGGMSGPAGNAVGVAGMQAAPSSPLQVQAAAQPGFDQVLADIAGATVNRLQTAETLSMRRIAGEDVAVRDVVNAVMDAEQSLNTAVAIRDKIVQAYLEVSRMQI